MIDYLGDNPIETDEDCVLQMLCYDRTDLSERIDVANSNSRRVAQWLATCAWKQKVPGWSPFATYVQR